MHLNHPLRHERACVVYGLKNDSLEIVTGEDPYSLESMVDKSQPIRALGVHAVTLKSSRSSSNVDRVSRGRRNRESARDTNAFDGLAMRSPRGGFINRCPRNYSYCNYYTDLKRFYLIFESTQSMY